MQYRSMLWAVVIFFAGCASAPAPDARSSAITFAVQDRSYDEIWSAIERVAGKTLTIVDRSKAFGTLKATKGVLMQPWGDVITFTIQPARSGAAEYSIELASISQPGNRLPTDDWAKTIAIQIRSELGR